MKIILDSGKEVKISELSFTDWRRFMSEYLSTNPHSGKAWDILSCVRGPDSPSERPDMTSEENFVAYAGRRARKYNGNKVTLPSQSKHDHFDRHVEYAAAILGLKVKYEDEEV